MAETGTAQAKTLNCQNCGAPLEYLEGEAVLTCSHCGTTTMLAGFDSIVKIESNFLLPPKLAENAVVSAARGWLSKGFFKAKGLSNGARLESSEGIALPYWIIRTRARTMWKGMKKRSREEGTGSNKKTVEWWEPVQGDFTETYTWPVYARENATEYWGLDLLKPGSRCLFPDWGKFVLTFGLGSGVTPNASLLEGREPFDVEKVNGAGMKIVNGQITSDRAEQTGRNDIISKHDSMAKSMADRITDCDTTATVDGVDLVYLPLWELAYGYGGKTYRMLLNGFTGKVVAAEYPVGRSAKITVFDIFFGVIGGILLLVGLNGSHGVMFAGLGVLALAVLYTVLGLAKKG